MRGAVAVYEQPSGAVVAIGIGEHGDVWIAPPELSLDASGRIYVATVAEGGHDVVVARFTVDGAPDESWGLGGRRTVSGAEVGVEAVTESRGTGDGGMLIAGRRFTESGAVDVAPAKLSLTAH